LPISTPIARRARPAGGDLLPPVHAAASLFFRWLSRRSGVPDPFLDLAAPKKPQQEADWLTPAEFAQLLAAACAPAAAAGAALAERDRLVLLVLVATGLRRSELIALDWADLELEGAATPRCLSAAARAVGRAASRCLPSSRARALAAAPAAAARPRTSPVCCGLGGGPFAADDPRQPDPPRRPQARGSTSE